MDRKGSGTAVKTGERKENMGAWLRRLGRAMKDDRGGYAMITVLVICGMVVGMFIWATLTIVEQSYTAQERQFARQTELLKAQGNLEATRANLEAWASEEAPLPVSDLTEGEIKGKFVGEVEAVGEISTAFEKHEVNTEEPIIRQIQFDLISDDVKATIVLSLTCKVAGNEITEITGIETSYVSYEEVQG